MGWWGSGLVGWIQEVNSRAKSTSFGSKVQELHKQGQGTMDWLGSGLVGWIQELYQQSPRALQEKSKSFTSKVREPWAGKGLVWCGGLKSFTSKVQELYQQSPRALQARSGNHGLVGVWFGGLDSRASRAKSKSFTRKVQELYKQSQGTMGW